MKKTIPFLLFLLVLLGCDDSSSNDAGRLPPILTKTPTQIPVDPAFTPDPNAVATQEPMVARVNGQPIFQSQYDAQIAQLQAWYPNGIPDDGGIPSRAMNNLIEQALVMQAADLFNITVDSAELQQRVLNAIISTGGEEAFQVWLDSSGFADTDAYTQYEQQELLRQRVRDVAVGQNVPTAAEYVRARYIQVDSYSLAEKIIGLLNNGADFESLVMEHSIDPFKETRKGDLGLFARDTLLVREIEDAAFQLQLNEISGIVPVRRRDGSEQFAIVQTLQRENQSVSAEERATLLQEAFDNWLNEQKVIQQIEILN